MVAEWQNRPLEAMYPLIFFDALRVKIRDEGLVRNKAVYVALGVTADETKDIPGLWIEISEDAKFWLRVMNELRTRGRISPLGILRQFNQDATCSKLLDASMKRFFQFRGHRIVEVQSARVRPTRPTNPKHSSLSFSVSDSPRESNPLLDSTE